jgi:hypothetical protein
LSKQHKSIAGYVKVNRRFELNDENAHILMGGIEMSIFLVETYVLRVEKQDDYHQQ